jgi:hypothetical protein
VSENAGGFRIRKPSWNSKRSMVPISSNEIGLKDMKILSDTQN